MGTVGPTGLGTFWTGRGNPAGRQQDGSGQGAGRPVGTLTRLRSTPASLSASPCRDRSPRSLGRKTPAPHSFEGSGARATAGNNVNAWPSRHPDGFPRTTQRDDGRPQKVAPRMIRLCESHETIRLREERPGVKSGWERREAGAASTRPREGAWGDGHGPRPAGTLCQRLARCRDLVGTARRLRGLSTAVPHDTELCFFAPYKRFIRLIHFFTNGKREPPPAKRRQPLY